MNTKPFLERIQQGEVLISDGATGTNLQARGLQKGKPTEAWLFEHPEKIIQLHMDFIEAGADIILTNTFGANPIRLEIGGMVVKAEEVNKTAVALARQAVGEKPIYIAGSIGPSGHLIKPFGPLDEEAVLESYSTQAQALSEADIDLFVIETQFDLNEARLALKAVHSTSQKPVVVSFSYDRGTRTMMGVRPSQMAKEFADAGADLLGINCGRSLEDNITALQELRQSTQLPLWFKPNAGLPRLDQNDQAIYDLIPEMMGEQTPLWIKLGASVVGGCCGTSPEHLNHIAKAAKGV